VNREFPTIEEVIATHDLLIEEIGGAHGLRDEGALASAVWRPQMGYYSSLIEEAAALMESLSQNHPFVDGNKRVAFVITDTFLRMNGYYINCLRDDAYAFFMELYESHSFRFANLIPWLEECVKPLP
jgi:death-on-curing protein